MRTGNYKCSYCSQMYYYEHTGPDGYKLNICDSCWKKLRIKFYITIAVMGIIVLILCYFSPPFNEFIKNIPFYSN